MRNDPRENPNHGRSMEDQEFWNEAARLPWAKVLLRKEQFWTERRNVWRLGGDLSSPSPFRSRVPRLQQYGKVIRDNKRRLNMAEQLEDCPAACFLGARLVHLRQVELKRLVAPMLHFRLVEQLLIEACEQAQAAGRSLKDFLHEGPGQELRLEIVAACESPHQAGERGVFIGLVPKAELLQEELEGRLRALPETETWTCVRFLCKRCLPAYGLIMGHIWA